MSEKSFLNSEGKICCKKFDEVSRGWSGMGVSSIVSTYIGESNYKKITDLVSGYFIEGLNKINYDRVAYIPNVNEEISITLHPREYFTFPVNAPITIQYGKLEYSDNSNVESGTDINYTTKVINNPKWDMQDFINIFSSNKWSSATGNFNEKVISKIANIRDTSDILTRSLGAGESFVIPYDTHFKVTNGGVLVNNKYKSTGTKLNLVEGDLIRSCWKLNNLESLMENDTFYPTIYGTVDGKRIYQMIKVSDPTSSVYSDRVLIASEKVTADTNGTGITAYAGSGDNKKDNYQSFLPLGANDYESKVGDKLGSSNQNTVLQSIIPLPCNNVVINGTPIVSTYQSYSRTAILQYSLDKINWISFTSEIILNLNQGQKVYVRQLVDTTSYGDIPFSSFTSTEGIINVYIDYSCFNSKGIWIKTDNGIEKLDEYCPYLLKIENPSKYVSNPFVFNSESYLISNTFTYDFSKFSDVGLWLELDGVWTSIENKIYYASDIFNINTGSVQYNSDKNYVNSDFIYTFDHYGYGLNLCNSSGDRLFTINVGIYTIIYHGESKDKSLIIDRESKGSSTYLTDKNFITGSINEFKKISVPLDTDGLFSIKDSLLEFSKVIDFTIDVWDNKITPPKSGYIRLYGQSNIEIDFYNVKKVNNYYKFYSINKEGLFSIDASKDVRYSGYIMIQGYMVFSNDTTCGFITRENNSYFKEIGEI